MFNLAFVSQELLSLKETKHYRFSLHIGNFNAASRWVFCFFLFFALYEIFIIWVDVLHDYSQKVISQNTSP